MTREALQEQNSRLQLTGKIDYAMDAARRLEELKLLYEEVAQMGEVVKYVQIRIFVVESTLRKLRERIAEIMSDLEADDYKSAIMLNEQAWEWKSMFESYQEQQEHENARYGQPLTSQAIAGGNPFIF